MATFKTFIFLCFCFLLSALPLSSAQNAVKAAYWFPASEFPASDIDSTHFTHLFCAFADLNSQTNQVTVSSSNAPKFSSFTQTVRLRNPSVKTLLSIGGGSSDKSAFASMAAQFQSRKTFIDSSIKLARTYNFHGLDLDWEYPSSASDMANLGTLFTEWRAAINAESRSSGRAPLLLAAAVFYSSDYYSRGYPVQAMAKSLDWINVMAYDFYGPGWSKVTGPPAALRNPQGKPSGDSGVSDWIGSGMPANKIVIGFPYYGYGWRLSDPNNHGLFAPTNGPAFSGDGSMGYNQIRQFITNNGAVTIYDSSVAGDYCYSGTTWIAYDDHESIVSKVWYAKNRGLRGYFAWHVGIDDNWGLSSAASRTWDTSVMVPEVIKQTVEAVF